MKNLDNLKKQYEALGAEIAKLEAEWPRVGDKYYTVDGAGRVQYYEHNRSYDEGCISIGNCFRTNEEAEAEADARLVVAELKRQPGAKRFSDQQADWGIVINLSSNSIRDMYNLSNIPFGLVYFYSGESCRKAIAAVGEDRILKAARWWACGSVE